MDTKRFSLDTVVNLARLVGITVGVAVLGGAWAGPEAPAPMLKEVCHA
jgi:hypothetical protein